MKHFSLFLILLFTSAIYSQKTCPNLESNSNRIFRVSEINPDRAKDSTCKKYSYSGKITGLGYYNDQSAAVTSITVQLADGTREKAYFDGDRLLECFSEADKEIWKAQIVKNARVKITVWICGAGEKSDPVLESVEFIPSIKIKSKR